jgi:hypothetical protein
MSDFNSSLPIRTQTNGDVVAQLVDGTIVSQKLTIDASGRLTTKLNDGNGNIVTSQINGAQRALDVGIDVAGVQIDPRSIRALTSADVITANQGTSPWISKDQSDGPVTPGTAASFSSLIGGQFNTALPTLTNGQQSALQSDSSGRLIVSATFSNDTNFGTVGANTLRSAAQIGNATGAADFNSGVSGAQTLRTASNLNDGVGTPISSSLINSKQRLDVNLVAGGPVTPGTVAFQSLLIGGQFNTVLPTLTTGQQASIQVDSSGRLLTVLSGTSTVTVSNFPTTVDTNYGTVGASTIRTASQLGNATGAANFGNGATGAQTLRVAANLAIAGADVTAANPVPVTISPVIPGTPVDNYNTASAIAAAGTSNHDYTVTAAKTFYTKNFLASASGKLKIEVQYETAAASGVFNSVFVGFNSTANPNIEIPVPSEKTQVAGARIRIIRTNLDLLAQDVYSTTSGTEQ